MTFREWVLDTFWRVCVLATALTVFLVLVGLMEWMAQSWAGFVGLSIICTGWMAAIASWTKK